MAGKSGGESRFAPKATPPAPTRPISIERSVDEGVLIASAAVVMDVKNLIIVDAIRDGSTFDVDNVTAAVRNELRDLAEENESSANRVQQLSVDVQTRRGPRDNSEGYQVDDHPTLTKRGIIHVMLAAELERLSEDPEFLAELAERARVQAWAEVGGAIESRLLESVSTSVDPSYEEEKPARVRALVDINLRALEKQAKRRARRSHS
ncbi:MAG: hypothetical protein QOD50_1535 [Actinomycetota bacterium]|nr:hypothetical protein [Actinomycetota bacterium]